MKNKILLLLFLSISVAFSQKGKKPVISKNPAKTSGAVQTKAPSASSDGIFAEFETSKGKIVIQLEYTKTPITVANFVTLVEGKNTFVKEDLKGKPYYDGLKFHRVIKDFMIQGGDPAGNGSGGTGYSFKDEFTDAKFDKGGILAMANSGPATNSSQFFITHKDTQWLNGKHTIFGYVVTGMDVVNAIAQDDVMKKITITRKGAASKKFDAVKTFSDYYATKGDEDKIRAEAQKQQAIAAAEAQKKQDLVDAEAKKVYVEKYAPILAEKVAYLAGVKAGATTTASGLQYKIIKKGAGVKPADGADIFVHYAGYLEDGSLFDSSYEDVNRTFGKYDENRAKQNGYQPFPFKFGSKTGLIPGFLEGVNLMSFDDKIVMFIPANLGYGERGAGKVIPPNSNIIFEVELLEKVPVVAPK